MKRVNLPPGCSSLAFADGGPPAKASRPGGHVTVSDRRAAMINSMSGNGTAGLVNGNAGEFMRARNGRRCTGCDRRWMPWVTSCHKCGAATEPE